MTLQRSQIVATALQLLTQDGLEGVTVVTLAQLFVGIVGALRAEGFQADEARWLCMTVVSYTFGFVIEEQAGPTPSWHCQLTNKAK